MVEDSYTEILRDHGHRIDICKDVGSVVYMGDIRIEDVEGEVKYCDGTTYPYSLKDMKVYSGMWEIELDNLNPQILTKKGRDAKRIGGKLIYKFDMVPVEIPDDEFGGDPWIHYELETHQDYHSYITADLICMVEDIVREYIETI